MDKEAKGKVYFVGAGPGAVDLITVRGMRLIESADVIIYAGSLVNPELLKINKSNCEIYNSAKMTLEEVITVMMESVDMGKMVVRLHTGDQSIYGAVREQMDALDKAHIDYESCPGVSAAFGAAASLDLEYTLPEVSQSLIITRMEGKTPVPKSESIESFAAHRASMAIYLSSGMLDELGQRLVAGGYDPDTPAAIVYKATWPEEKKIITVVSKLGEEGRKANITKTAIVLVGDVLSKEGYSKSRLYAPDFSTEYRRGISQNKIICFTGNGLDLACRISDCLDNSTIYYKGSQDVLETKDELPGKYNKSDICVVEESIYDWTKTNFTTGDSIIFIGATGIAVRAISGCVNSKLLDPAVVVVDEQGKFIVPLLSGHFGGANDISEILSDKLGALPVITTATDINSKFSIDLFAKENNLEIKQKDGIAKVSSKALQGKPIVLRVINSKSPEKSDATVRGSVSFASGLYSVGVGCKRGTDAGHLKSVIFEALNSCDLSIEDVGCIASIDVKADEPAILEFGRQYNIPFITFDAQSLSQLEGDFNSSDFVLSKVGVDNVCERSAVLAVGGNSKLILGKYAKDGVTVAIAQNERD